MLVSRARLVPLADEVDQEAGLENHVLNVLRDALAVVHEDRLATGIKGDVAVRYEEVCVGGGGH